jgi:hypothetical protein
MVLHDAIIHPFDRVPDLGVVIREVQRQDRLVNQHCGFLYKLDGDEVGLPKLIGRRGLVLELIGRLHHDESRAGDQVVRLQGSPHFAFCVASLA